MKHPRCESDILICLPTYNERANVCELVSRIRALPLTADVLFVDDKSPDGTGAVLEDLSRQETAVHVIHRTSRQGIGSAHKAAVRYAYQNGYRFLVTMDADGTHAPEDIPGLIEAAESNDIVIGSRFLATAADHRNRWQTVQSLLAHRLTSRLLHVPCDMTNAFRLYRLEEIDAAIFSQCRSDSYAFFPESLYRLHQQNLRIKEIPVSLNHRQTGKSKMRLQDIGEWAIRLLLLRGWMKRSSYSSTRS